MAGSPKNCVSHATPYSRYGSSRKRLIIFAYFFLSFSDENCIQRVLIRSLNFSGIYTTERKKSTNPILTLVHEKYENPLNAVFIRKKRGILLCFFHNGLKENIAGIRAFICYANCKYANCIIALPSDMQIALPSDSDPYDIRFRQTFDPFFQSIKTVYRTFLPSGPLQTRVFLSHHWVKLGKIKIPGHQEHPINHIFQKNIKLTILYTWHVSNSNTVLR